MEQRDVRVQTQDRGIRRRDRSRTCWHEKRVNLEVQYESAEGVRRSCGQAGWVADRVDFLVP
jgi:hypothetical protein